MKDELAERLLASVMQWTPENIASERPIMQAMAAYKYDEYGQFSPGMRFVESLALWLNQFPQDNRQTAYNFVKNRLIFYSLAEMQHLVSIAYPDVIRPFLFDFVAREKKISNRYVQKIATSLDFKVLLRRCLFLGLSDGARTDIFRRSNSELSHEQIWQAYEMSTDKEQDMLGDLRKELKRILNREPRGDEACFQIVFLIDDFSASGRSYLRKINESEFKGKIFKFYKQIYEQVSNLTNQNVKFIDRNSLHICVVLYIATVQAKLYLEKVLKEFFEDKPINWSIKIVHQLSEQVPLNDTKDSEFLTLVDQDKFYDSSVDDEHTKVGGDNVKRGFAKCSLPLVLNHNTPNNSVFLLWADPELYKIRGLFPRVSRHRS